MTILTLTLFFLACCASTLALPSIMRYRDLLVINKALQRQLEACNNLNDELVALAREKNEVIRQLRATIMEGWRK